jgi:hypothetical protein
MKTPREILLEQYRSAETRLDAISENVLLKYTETTAVDKRRQSRPFFSPSLVAMKLWQELIWPCRRVWLGMAAIWFVVLAINMASNDTPKFAANQVPAPTPEMVAALREQKQLLVQLLDPNASTPALPAAAPRPRSQRRETVVLG